MNDPVKAQTAVGSDYKNIGFQMCTADRVTAGTTAKVQYIYYVSSRGRNNNVYITLKITIKFQVVMLQNIEQVQENYYQESTGC